MALDSSSHDHFSIRDSKHRPENMAYIMMLQRKSDTTMGNLILKSPQGMHTWASHQNPLGLQHVSVRRVCFCLAEIVR